MEDYAYGRTYIDPKHVSDGGVTPDHVRRWKVLQELQASLRHSLYSLSVPYACSMHTYIGSVLSANDTVGRSIVLAQDLQARVRGC